MDIIFLTDGVPGLTFQRPSDVQLSLILIIQDDRPGEVLVAAHERLKKSKHHPNCIGIQFVQIGNDPKAEVALKELMNGNIGVCVPPAS